MSTSSMSLWKLQLTTDTVVQWIVRDSRLINIFEDKSVTIVTKATLDVVYKSVSKFTNYENF